MAVRLPDYHNGLVNLSCSILKYYDADYSHPTLPVLDQLLEKEYQNIIVMLLDGMGMDALQHHLPPDSYLRKHLVSGISSVFPPTTTAATTSVESGLTPAEHGWIGWGLYFKELDKIVNIFPNTVKFTNEQAADYHVASRQIPYKTIYSKIEEAGKAKAYSVSKFGSNPIATFEGMILEITRLCHQDDRKFIYSYWEDPDVMMHMKGSYDEAVTAFLKDAERKIERLAGQIKNSLLLVIADHGHINLSHYILSEYPKLVKMMERPTTIEARAAGFYIKEEFRNQFPDEFSKTFGDDFVLYSRQELLENQLFGDGLPHARFVDFTGDFLAVAIKDKGIVNNPDSRRYASNHAGLTEQEMLVPLIALELY